MHPDEGIRESAAKVLGSSCAILGPEVTTELLLNHILSGNDSESTSRHGRACATRRILVSTASFAIDASVVDKLRNFSLNLIKDDKSIVREAGFASLGAAIGRAANPKSSLKSCEADFLKVMRDTKETVEIHRSVARGLCVALLLIEKSSQRVDFLGLSILDACLSLALKSSQRVQFAFYDVLWLALNVVEGDVGLTRYCDLRFLTTNGQ